jgi:hypothetical protein
MPVVHFCSHVPRPSSHPVKPVIEGFGEPSLNSYTEAKRLFYKPIRTLAELNTDLEESLRRAGVKVYNAVVARELKESRVKIDYYAEQPLGFEWLDHLNFSSVKECEDSGVRVQTILGGLEHKVLIKMCGTSEYSNEHNLSVLKLKGLEGYFLDQFDTRYSSISDCYDDSDRVIKMYESINYRKVVGTVCALERSILTTGENYAVYLFAKPRFETERP